MKQTKPKFFWNPKPLKQTARASIKIDDEELDKELVRKTINLFFFTNRVLKAGFNNLDSHIINNINSELTITPKYLEIEKFILTI